MLPQPTERKAHDNVTTKAKTRRRRTSKKDKQRLLHHYKQVTGKTEIDMHEVARFALKLGWPLPEPADPIDLLAEQLARAAREETRRDPHTGRPYRANHAYTDHKSQTTLWYDIDEATRPQIRRCLIQRREQTIGDVVQLSFDAEHWNNAHPKDEPLVMETDYTLDVELRRAAEELEKAKSSDRANDRSSS